MYGDPAACTCGRCFFYTLIDAASFLRSVDWDTDGVASDAENYAQQLIQVAEKLDDIVAKAEGR